MLRVAFIGPAAPEEDAAWQWLSERSGMVAKRYEARQPTGGWRVCCGTTLPRV